MTTKYHVYCIITTAVRNSQTGHRKIKGLVEQGELHESLKDAEKWLQDNSASGSSYTILPIYQ